MQGLGARSRRDLLRKTWVPTGKGLKTLEDEKSVVIRFVVGYRCPCPLTTSSALSVHGSGCIALGAAGHHMPCPSIEGDSTGSQMVCLQTPGCSSGFF